MIEINDIRLVTSAMAPNDWPETTYPEVAFIGRSNVGKSSLLNKLVGRRKLARISSTPGKTRTLNFYLADERIGIVDLPGFGYARVARSERNRWKRLIVQYLTSRPNLRLVFHLVDCRHDPTVLDHDVFAMMKGRDLPYVIVMTKSDKLSGNHRSNAVRKMTEVIARYGMELPVVLSSAHDGRGREELLGWVESLV